MSTQSPQPVPRASYAPGDRIDGKYRLKALLGEGGMGSVWVAENEVLECDVALKLIRAHEDDPLAAERFLTEARIAAQVQHPAIVRVIDVSNTARGEPIIVMELLRGETLGQRLTRLGRIDPVELLQTVLPIMEALDAAHKRGIVHRDLKPDNILIAQGSDGAVQPKLLDFGIAKLRGPRPRDRRLTQDGTLVGSPDYMSPEHVRGHDDIDGRSDVWSLCVLLYECMVGQPPFIGKDYPALLWSIVHEAPAPTTDRGVGDRALWRVLEAGLAKDRNGRTGSMRELGLACARWLESRGVHEDVCHRSLHASWSRVSSSPPTAEAWPSTAPTERTVRTSVRPTLRVPARQLRRGGFVVGLLGVGALGWWTFFGQPDAVGEPRLAARGAPTDDPVIGRPPAETMFRPQDLASPGPGLAQAEPLAHEPPATPIPAIQTETLAGPDPGSRTAGAGRSPGPAGGSEEPASAAREPSKAGPAPASEASLSEPSQPPGKAKATTKPAKAPPRRTTTGAKPASTRSTKKRKPISQGDRDYELFGI